MSVMPPPITDIERTMPSSGKCQDRHFAMRTGIEERTHQA
jgi:hypothetical protein